MKKSIQLQTPPDYSSLVPADLQPGGQTASPPTSSGIDMDNLSPEEADAIPDEGTANVGFKVHHRRSETKIHPKTGEKKESHSVRMHLHSFEPHPPEDAKPKKKLLQSTDAAEAVRDGTSVP